jgi:hypothetical protein
MNIKRTLSMTAAIALSIGMLSGCATTAQLEELKAEFAKSFENSATALSTANQASTDASNAQTTADSAKARADAAMDRANAAIDAANTSRRASDDNKETLSRMMQKAMAK